MTTINKTDLVNALSEKTGVSKAQMSVILNALTDEVTAQVASGNQVTLTGFGTFKTSDRAERKGRNPKTGEEITIPAGKTVRFSAGKQFKSAV